MFKLATFNVERIDVSKPGRPSLDQVLRVTRPQLERIDADILLLQELPTQEIDGVRGFYNLQRLLEGTRFEQYHFIASTNSEGDYYNDLNVGILSRFPFERAETYLRTLADFPLYTPVSTGPTTSVLNQDSMVLKWRRPILYVRVNYPDLGPIHVISLHLKSRWPTIIPGLYDADKRQWRDGSAVAEGYLLSQMRRLGQLIEARRIVDSIFDEDPDARIVVGGDFNADFAPGKTDLQNHELRALLNRLEDHHNPELIPRTLYSTDFNMSPEIRYSFLFQGHGYLLDHFYVSASMLSHHVRTDIHNERLHDEYVGFASAINYYEPDHAPVVVTFDSRTKNRVSVVNLSKGSNFTPQEPRDPSQADY